MRAKAVTRSSCFTLPTRLRLAPRERQHSVSRTLDGGGCSSLIRYGPDFLSQSVPWRARPPTMAVLLPRPNFRDAIHAGSPGVTLYAVPVACSGGQPTLRGSRSRES
jgi:hypothetical protein